MYGNTNGSRTAIHTTLYNLCGYDNVLKNRMIKSCLIKNTKYKLLSNRDRV